ncbi:hypothetical protein GCM10029964_059180 [Kibdelosporangium lantanae]
MARYDSTYHFGTTGDTVRQVYEHVRDALTREPVDVGTVHVTAPKLDELTVSFLYQKSLFPTLATILVTLRDLTGQGTADIQKAETALTKPMATDFMRATFWANLCGEGPWTGNRRTAVRDSDHAYDSGLTLVGGAWPLGQVCMFWTAPPRPLPTMDGKGVPPVLMLQSTHDPATPVEGARRAHDAFAGSRMVTVTGEGDHGLYGYGNQALDTLVNGYLVDGTVPADQSVPGMPLPPPARNPDVHAGYGTASRADRSAPAHQDSWSSMVLANPAAVGSFGWPFSHAVKYIGNIRPSRMVTACSSVSTFSRCITACRPPAAPP